MEINQGYVYFYKLYLNLVLLNDKKLSEHIK
jgi:hypothetical protein